MEREVGGGIRMGNTCKPMAVSFQCMTKPTTIKKIKIYIYIFYNVRNILQVLLLSLLLRKLFCFHGCKYFSNKVGAVKTSVLNSFSPKPTLHFLKSNRSKTVRIFQTDGRWPLATF